MNWRTNVQQNAEGYANYQQWLSGTLLHERRAILGAFATRRPVLFKIGCTL